MHGTGTPLGDPIEVGAACEVLAPVTGDAAECTGALLLEAAKAWAGHAEPAAGTLGIVAAQVFLAQVFGNTPPPPPLRNPSFPQLKAFPYAISKGISIRFP